MRRRMNPVVAVLAVLVAVAVVAIIFQREMQQPQPRAATTDAVLEGVTNPVQDRSLGVVWGPMRRRGGAMKVMGFRPPPSPPPLQAIGLREMDIVVQVNGEKFSVGGIHRAVTALKEKGTPFTLKVERGGQEMTIKVTQWPEASESPPEGPGSGRGPERPAPR